MKKTIKSVEIESPSVKEPKIVLAAPGAAESGEKKEIKPANGAICKYGDTAPSRPGK